MLSKPPIAYLLINSVHIWVMQIISRLNGQCLAIFPATDPSLQGKVSLGSVCPLNRSGLARETLLSSSWIHSNQTVCSSRRRHFLRGHSGQVSHRSNAFDSHRISDRYPASPNLLWSAVFQGNPRSLRLLWLCFSPRNSPVLLQGLCSWTSGFVLVLQGKISSPFPSLHMKETSCLLSHPHPTWIRFSLFWARLRFLLGPRARYNRYMVSAQCCCCESLGLYVILRRRWGSCRRNNR